MILSAMGQQSAFANKRESWQTWVSEGSMSFRRGDFPLAKRYYLGALTELEKKQVAPGTPLTSSISKLEHGLISLYPQDWSIDAQNPGKQLALQEEQVAVFARLSRVASRYASPDNTSTNYINGCYRKAVTDLQNTKTEIAKVKNKRG